jgi:hypothetical protein
MVVGQTKRQFLPETNESIQSLLASVNLPTRKPPHSKLNVADYGSVWANSTNDSIGVLNKL